MKIKLIIAILLFINGGTSLAKSINKLSINTIGSASSWSNTDILNGQLFFQDTFTEYLWVSDGSNNGSHVLEYNQQPIQLNLHRQSLISYQGSIYYINKSDQNTLWKTDGQIFEQVSADYFSVSKGLNIYNNYLIGALLDDSLVIIDEHGIKNLNLEGLSNNSINSLCIQGQNNYIMYSHFTDSVNHLYHIKDGQVQSLDGNIANSGRFSLSASNNGSCFYEYKDENNHQNNASSFIAVDETGIVTKIETEINGELMNTWGNFTKFNNSIYFQPKRNSGDTSDMFLYKYENSTLSAIQDIVFRYGSQANIFSSNNFLYIQQRFAGSGPDPVPPGYIFNTISVLDTNFNLIYQFPSDETNLKIISHSSNEDTIVFNQEISALGFINSSSVKTILTPNLWLNAIFADSQNTFIIGNDRNNSNASSIYVIKDQAIISQNLDGLWHNPEYNYQGLTIHTGEHIDGSQYLVASYRFFKNGAPFWIAGSANLNLKSTLTFNMYEYTGSSPYIPNDNGQNNQSIKYGELTLQAISCDRLNLQLTLTNNSSFNLDLERIGRSGRTTSCVD